MQQVDCSDLILCVIFIYTVYGYSRQKNNMHTDQHQNMIVLNIATWWMVFSCTLTAMKHRKKLILSVFIHLKRGIH